MAAETHYSTGRRKTSSARVFLTRGNGNIVHSSSYWGHVVEREMKHVDGYVGARRLTG